MVLKLSFNNPIRSYGPDPWMIKNPLGDGYYFCYTTESWDCIKVAYCETPFEIGKLYSRIYTAAKHALLT